MVRPNMWWPHAARPDQLKPRVVCYWNNEQLIQQRLPRIENPCFIVLCSMHWMTMTVASIGLMSPGLATDGVTPIFFLEKLTSFLLITVTFVTFFVISHECHPPWRVSPPGGCHHGPFLPVRPRLTTVLLFFVNPHYFHSGVTPWRESPEAVRPRPPSDATGQWHAQDRGAELH